MKRLTILCAAVLSTAVVAAPAGAASTDADAKKAAHVQCKAEKKTDKAAFKATYGKHAMRTCVKGEKTAAVKEARGASKNCKAERAADPAAFTEKYGQGGEGIGKCVSRTVRAENAEDVAEFKNAAKACRAERTADPEAFRTTYGTKSGKNAFGKCVSSKVKKADAGAES